MNSAELKVKNRKWLKEDVFPLWIENGIDKKNGSFVESLSSVGVAELAPRRALVQARQIYSFTEAAKLSLLDRSLVESIVEKNLKFLENYSLPNGAYIHSVDAGGTAVQQQSELYTQAFMLFGLARAYELLQKSAIRQRALSLVQYLKRERSAPFHSFTEIKEGRICYQSNPHMHLFEAVLEWLRIDRDGIWLELSQQLADLCLQHFMNNSQKVIAEYFSADWKVELTSEGHFIFEPGHQYEWAWLFLQFEKLSKKSFVDLATKLFATAEKSGVQSTGLVVDELWSDFTVKKSSARFWPQCERIKIAVELKAFAAADQGMTALHQYLNVSKRGLWIDTITRDSLSSNQSAKASSLYHIINAMSDYDLKR